jgi:putative addiction module component (TIGR02574 family)
MPMTKEQILEAAKELDEAEREELVEELLLSLPENQLSHIEAAWLEEVKRRDAAFRAGQMTASPVDEVITRILSKARK